jgi:arylformamidase
MSRLSLSMHRALIVAMVGVLTVVAAGCDPLPDCTSTGSVAHRDLRYENSPGTSANLQSLDLYTPVRPSACSPAPLVVYVHGGGFVNGDKTNKISQKVDLFTGEGWAFASLNYRLVGDPGAGPTNGVYPAAEQDIASAVAYLHRQADQYRLDAQNTMLLGHSAGAFLVALTSTDGSFLEGAGLDLSDINCAAPLDTTYDIRAQIARGGTEEAMFRNAFGDDPAVWSQASPPNNVAPGKGIPAFHIVTRGTAPRINQSQAFGTTLRNAGVAADVQVVTGLSHEEVNVAVGQAGETRVTGPLMTFYRGCVAGDQAAG